MMTNKQVTVVVDSVLRVKKSDLDSQAIIDLHIALTKQNPSYYQMLALCNSDKKKFQYVALPPKYIQSYYEDNDTIYIPRGSINQFKQIIKRYGQTIKFYDERIKNKVLESLRLNDNITEIEYQNKVISSALFHQQGIIVAPCGSGKTIMGIGLICKIKRPTLIVVHTIELLNQWASQLRNKTNLEQVGQVGGGAKRPLDITVATIQTLYRLDSNTNSRPILHKFLSKFDCIILDECHHVPAETFLEIINLSPSLYRFGLTATPSRKDGKHFLMYDTFGEIIYNVTDNELEAANRTQSCDVFMIETNFYTEYSANEWIQLIDELINDGDRNDLIIKCIVNSFKNLQSFPLVLSDRVAHCKYISKRLTAEGLNVGLLIGEIDKFSRKMIIDAANKQKFDVIIGTTIADEGLDIPALSDVHLVTPTNNKSKVQQRTGRIRRPKDKNSIIHDYCDFKVKSLLSSAKKRIGYYKSWGFNVTYYNKT